jgi:hypothetical protein
MGTLLLHIFIYVDVLILGALLAIAGQHAYAHFRPHKHDQEKPHIPESVKERMLRKSEMEYQTVLEHSVKRLQHDLESSSEQINGLIKRFAGEIVGDEMEKYRQELAKLHKQAEADMSGIKAAVGGHQAEIEAKMAEELEAEKQFLIKQIDTKLGDAVASFLMETLQHNVDLGSQREYLITTLDAHKEELKQGVVDEAQPAK